MHPYKEVRIVEGKAKNNGNLGHFSRECSTYNVIKTKIDLEVFYFQKLTFLKISFERTPKSCLLLN